MPDGTSTHKVVEAAKAYYKVAKSLMIRPWDHGQSTLHATLAYGGGHPNLVAVMATYDQPGSAVIARMLLEETARHPQRCPAYRYFTPVP